MKVFNLNDVKKWVPLAVGEILEAPCPYATRKVHLRFNVDRPVAVYISDDEAMQIKTLAAYESGMFDVRATISATAYFVVEADPDADVFVQEQVGNQVIPRGNAPSYTTLEPRRRNSEFDRMMHMVRLNEKRRDEILARDLRAQRVELEKVRAELRAGQEAEAVIEAEEEEASE